MSWSSVVAARLRGLFGNQRLESELDDEVRCHLEMQIDDNIRAGMNPEEARYAAMRSFGGLQRMKETYRERSTFMLIETMAQDLRYAIRTLIKNPGFTITSVAVLALAIGANTAMFSVLNTVLLRPLPYKAPEQLAVLWTEDQTQNLREGRSALWDVEQWRHRSQSFAEMATFDPVSMTLSGSDGADQVAAVSISPNLLPLLGVQPIEGRNFSAEEAEQRQRLVMISHRFWRARFGASRDALGATLVLSGFPHQIIGILPPDFQLAGLNPDIFDAHPTRQSVRGGEMWSVIGRLRPAVTVDQAQGEMTAVARFVNDQLPAAYRNRSVRVVPFSLYMVGPQSRLGLWMLGGALFFVFLIAAANVTSLSLARSVARAREMAVRAALGASGGRLARQLLTESVLLAAVAGLIGALLASTGIQLIRAFGPVNLPRLNEVTLDLRSLGWAIGISLLAGILVGLAPAVTRWRRDIRPSGVEGGRSVSGGTATSQIRRALVVAEFALAIVLLVGAGLLVRSWWKVTNIDPGFRPERVLTVELSTPSTYTATTQRTDLYRRALEEIHSIPRVESAGIIGDLFSSHTNEQVATVEGANGTNSERLRYRRGEVSADFFTALKTKLLRGRFFSVSDGPEATRVALINDALARRLWPDRDPVGRRFKPGPRESERPWYTVIGVVADMRLQGLEREPVPQFFESIVQNPPQTADLFIRTSADDPLSLASAIQAAIRRVDKNAPIYGVSTLEAQFGTYLAQRRFQTSLLAGFSIVALLMAAVGIYGLIQYSIATRTQEIGIRMAVGAQASQIFRMILGDGLKLCLIGSAIGIVGAVWLSSASSSLLFGVRPTDALTFVAVSMLLITVAIAACCFPARRAIKIEPVIALRPE